jgi:multidrug efflux pump
VKSASGAKSGTPCACCSTPDRLAAYQTHAARRARRPQPPERGTALRAALKATAPNSPCGRWAAAHRDRTSNDMIIKETEGSIVRFKDIGEAQLAPENERTILRGNGLVPMVGVAITPQPGSNYVAIADEFYKRVEKIKAELPKDLKLGIALDTTVNIRKAITEVEETIFIAFALVVLVIFVFLRDWRTRSSRYSPSRSRWWARFSSCTCSASQSTFSRCWASYSQRGWWWTTPLWCSKTST